MLSAPRSLEVIIFALANFLPYVLLSVYAFQKRLRFSKMVTAIVCFVLLMIQFATRYWSVLHNVNTNIFMSLLRLAIFIGIYLLLFQVHWGKVLFLELIFANIGNFIIIAAICLDRNLFLATEHRVYCWHVTLIMLLFHLLFTIPMYFAIRRWAGALFESPRAENEWYYYWFVPAIFYIIWQYQVNGNEHSLVENMMNPYNVVFLFIINVGSIFIYMLMLRLNGQLTKNLDLETRNHYLDLEKVEYRALQDKIDETRRIRHDLRHHIHIMNDYLKTKEYDKLQEYLNTFRNSIPDGDNLLFCEHRTINSIILYFATLAKQQAIDFDVRLAITDNHKIADNDIAVLLGNLLENAIDACTEQKSPHRRVIIKGSEQANSLVFTIDNTCDNEIKKNRNGDFLTTKADGHGIGLTSVKKIVERYNGIFSAEKKDDMFYVSFMLNL